MKRSLLLLALASTTALASPFDPADELAQRSGLPASEVRAMLSNCDAAQANMNFCAWRDQLVAEHALQSAVDAKAGVSTSCRSALAKRIDVWKHKRDAGCRRSAETEWGGGSMLPAAVAMCATKATQRMTNTIRSAACG
ncbi:lysozyme inhibitor LprI family protein [Paraburkholderia caballeronis]|uniref:Lysozyme inhibitor LprI-like N-terminal domain-containing protein n=1 Tax=Paraburkholderia caballeronis TaxID=416943 RepID=A0A1H7QEG8_9BURK|nr:lysozyme inhibitor LprI family protein [Paraburkholderia caballeronis]PXW16413.1 uncharacterized protein DUF1311 [Paraburkholderia caballeronis]PXW94090.1 uncharacterized protein DUF1311 [Paraburkholderia caballeronis]RAJ89154.1 uncharacterized protein DUF1311 [Paraburkholderia caballeronis]SEE08860.1 Protein of unknown function [Paraburkholderia caballeronis]SEL46034.1 Protein of unknown function [Paraburkholderia caballeronis]